MTVGLDGLVPIIQLQRSTSFKSLVLEMIILLRS